MSDAPERLWINWHPSDSEHPPTMVGAALATHYLMEMKYPVRYIRADIPDLMADPRVKALVEAAKDAIVSMQEARSVVVPKREHQVLTDAVAKLRASLAAMKGGA